jgi:hypothetical protein
MIPLKDNDVAGNFMRVTISPLLIAEWLKTGWHIPDYPVVAIECIEGLPKDAKYIRGAYDSMRDEFILIFEHPSFDAVLHGADIPIIRPMHRNTYAAVEQAEVKA